MENVCEVRENICQSPQRQVRICQNTTCSKSGAAAVLHTFRDLALPDVEVIACGCLGQCGNGPMVIVLPEQIWYGRVRSLDVPAIATQHLIGGDPVLPLLYDAQMHPQLLKPKGREDVRSDRPQLWTYAFLLLTVLVAIGSVIWTFVAL
ncbi:MAG: (2Fe-2S) ferredoxin domain-containing protein [Cyanobacteria bacterium J06626_18]